jgi:hypothetical protein
MFGDNPNHRPDEKTILQLQDDSSDKGNETIMNQLDRFADILVDIFLNEINENDIEDNRRNNE